MSDNTDRLQMIFNRTNMSRNNIRYKLNRTLYDHVSFMENKIRKQLKTFTLLSICGGQRANFVVNPYFQNAFTALTLQQKVLYFQKTIQYIKKNQEQKQNNQITTEEAQLQQIKDKYGSDIRIIIQINTGFRSWQQETINVSGFKINSVKKINLDLRNYLIRKSKKKQVDCHVLQAIRVSKPQTVRFVFKRKQEQQKYLPLLKELINAAYYDFICKESACLQVGIMKKNPKTGKLMISLDQKNKMLNSNNQAQIERNEDQQDNQKQGEQINMKRSHQISVSYQLMRTKDQQQIQQDLEDLIDKQNEKNQMAYPSTNSITKSQKKILVNKKNYPNIFSTMLPSYNLNQLDSLHNFQPVYSEKQIGMFIFKNRHNPHRFKMEMPLKVPPHLAMMALYNIQLFKSWNPCVSEGQQKFRISSQNCSIFYQKHHSFSQWYRQRDFLYLKHLFLLNKTYYIVDKSFQNTNFVPFTSIERGKINHCITRITQNENGSSLMIDIDMDHGGLLKEIYQQELTLSYLKGYSHLSSFCSNEQFKKKLVTYFYHEWNIEQTMNNDSQFTNLENLKTEDFEQASQINNKSIDQSDLYFSVDDLDRQNQPQVSSEHQIKQEQIIQKEQHMKQTWTMPSKKVLDDDGRILVSQKYIKKRHIKDILPTSQPRTRIQRKFDHIILQDNWRHISQGGLQIINQKKIEAQNNVFGFILKKLRQNIFSGKGLTNISLPVQVFNCDSNLSRLCRGFALAPQFLQKAAKVKDPVARMKFTMLFALASSIFFLDAQKPFNPILGETYQGIIDGCPVYAQQISHHPPISYFYMLGRGYKIYGGVEARVNLHINSADGLNEGLYHVLFDDGQKISFTTPPGEVSNTTMGGNRKFNFLEKGYYFDIENRLYAEIKFQQETGLFSKGKWKYRDQIQAEIVKLKQSYMSKVADRVKEKKSPSDKQIEQRFNKLSGRWFFEVFWDQESAYKPNQLLPFVAQDYEYPLPSDCFYREDIYYRIMQDLSRSQIQKQRLEVFQRGDRKFRQKYHKKQH